MRKQGLLRVGVLAPIAVAVATVWVGGQMHWTRHTPALNPPLRSYHAMAYDASRRYVMVFGGHGFPALNDTWEWNGTVWVQRTPATSPPVLGHHAMAYDAVHQRVVLFGGSSYLNDTWEWDGTTWTQRAPATNPPPRHGHAMAYDAARRRVTLFGGFNASYLSDTWVWQGSTWIRRTPPVSPSPRQAHAMAYDAARQGVVLYGGANATHYFGDTWMWNGSAWVKQTPAASPSARGYHTMAFDAARQRTVLFGGMDMQSLQLNDTWEYAGTHLVSSGTPRPGGVMSYKLSAVFDAGRPYQVGSSLGTGPIPLGGLSLGLSLDNLLVVSLAGALPGIFQGYSGVIDSSGQAAAAIRIPPFPALVGTTIHSAFLTVNPAAPQGIRSISNTESFQIVP